MTPAAPPDPNRWRPASVREVVTETPRAVTVRLAVEDWPGHVAGQRVDVRLTAEDGYQAVRAYSVANAPGGATVDLTVDEIAGGEVSPWFTETAAAGDQLEVRGPIGGAFTWAPEDGGPVLLVGGGSGVVPLMAIARAHAAAGDAADVRLLVSARTLTDLLYRAELDRLHEAGLIRRHVTLTRAVVTPAGREGSDRRVDGPMLAQLGPDPAAGPRIYICGPTGFVDAVAGLCMRLGHPAAAIRTERFGPTARTATAVPA